jgi:O-antigen/teichoic acid export membrane protein
MPGSAASLRRNTVLLMLSNIGGAALSFALSALIGRALGEAGLGIYAVSAAWIFPLALIADFGISTLMTRDLSASPEDCERYLRASALARGGFGGLLMISLIVLAPWLSRDPAVVEGIRISAPLILILPFYSSFTAVFKAHNAMRLIPWLNIGMLLSQVILTTLAFALGGGVRAAIIINVATSLGQLIAAYLAYRARFAERGPAEPLSPLVRRLIQRSWKFAVAGLLAAMQIRLSTILLEQLTNAGEVGYFSAGSRFMEAARLIPNAYFGALFPALSAVAADPQAMQRVFGNAFRLLILFGIACALGAWLAAPVIIPLVFGDGFTASVPVLQMLMIALGFSVVRGLRTLYWYAHGREGYVNVVNAVVIVAQIALSLVLLPPLGALGAAIVLLMIEWAALLMLWREIPFTRWLRRIFPDALRPGGAQP